MERAIILYAPDEDKLKNASERIQRTLVNEKYEVEVKAAKNSSIVDITASDIVIVGFNDAKSRVHPDFKAIDKALTGINLAGRVAGFFTFDTADAMVHFRKSFHDSDIIIFETPLILGPGDDGAKGILNWVHKLLAGALKKHL